MGVGINPTGYDQAVRGIQNLVTLQVFSYLFDRITLDQNIGFIAMVCSYDRAALDNCRH